MYTFEDGNLYGTRGEVPDETTICPLWWQAS